MSVINRVWDAHLTGAVSWKTVRADSGGHFYPGPGVFSTQASDFCVESIVENEQPLVASVQHTLIAPTGSVEALWPFDGDMGDITANEIDLSMVSGVERYGPGIAGSTQALSINDSLATSVAGSSDAIRLLGAMTFEVLFFPYEFVSDTTDGYICSFENQGAGTDNNTLWALRLLKDTNEMRYLHEDSGETERSSASGVSIIPGRWYHLAFTRDAGGTLIRQYVNGYLVSREVLGGAPFGGANSHIQLGDEESSSRRIAGAYSSMRIVSAEFTPEQILADARATLPPGCRP